MAIASNARVCGCRGSSEAMSRACSRRVTVELADGVLRIGLADSRGDVRGYIKLERTQPRVMIFDVESWHRIDDIAASREAAAHVEPVAVAQRVSL